MNSDTHCTIPALEVRFHAHSFGDPGGRVFFWDDQLYRGIRATKMSFFKNLFENGTISNLVERGLLIDTELTHLTFDEYPMIVRHHTVPFISYPQEWCAPMLKDAALTILELAIELARYELILQDAHPWNLLFDAYKPVYVDFGSIAPIGSVATWPAYDEFCHYCLYPLILMSQGHDLIGRLLMYEDRGVRENEVFRLAPGFALPTYIHWSIQRMVARAAQLLTRISGQSRNQKFLLNFLKQVRRQVESIPLPSLDDGLRKGDSRQPQEHNNIWSENQARVKQLLSQLRPGSVLDVNSGNGWLAMQAAHLGSQVVAFDMDPKSVSRLYRTARAQRLAVLPLVMDFTKPTPARGVGNHWAIAATDRFQCDLVLALGPMDQPILKRLGFDQIIAGLGQFTKRWLVLEFPPEDSTHNQMNPNQFGGLTFENCSQLLERQFRTVTRLLPHPQARTLFVCEK